MEEFISGEMELCQDGILEGKAFVPWFLSSVHVFEPDKGTAVLDLPDGFLMADLEEGVFIPDEQGGKHELLPKDWVSGVNEFGTGEKAKQGLPQYYALFGENKLQLFPAPEYPVEIVFAYYKKDTPIGSVQSTGENLWLKHAPDVFVNEVGMACAEVVRDKDAYNLFTKRVQVAWRNLEARHTERRLAGQELYFFGGK